uniref:Uncharacterized protein n=1 Tax=Arundo donax TaxID=35708 RepID=A0A0A8ZAJ6_ARUDO
MYGHVLKEFFLELFFSWSVCMVCYGLMF